jgi:hypothetical protein
MHKCFHALDTRLLGEQERAPIVNYHGHIHAGPLRTRSPTSRIAMSHSTSCRSLMILPLLRSPSTFRRPMTGTNLNIGTWRWHDALATSSYRLPIS